MIPGADDLETPPKQSRSDEGHLSSQGDGATVLVILTEWKPWLIEIEWHMWHRLYTDYLPMKNGDSPEQTVKLPERLWCTWFWQSCGLQYNFMGAMSRKWNGCRSTWSGLAVHIIWSNPIKCNPAILSRLTQCNRIYLYLAWFSSSNLTHTNVLYRV